MAFSDRYRSGLLNMIRYYSRFNRPMYSQFIGRKFCVVVLITALLQSITPIYGLAHGGSEVSPDRVTYAKSESNTVVSALHRLFPSKKGGAVSPGAKQTRLPSKLQISARKREMALDQTQQLTALVTSDDDKAIDGARIEWSSSEPSIAEIDETGSVTAHAIGEVVINAASGSLKDSVRITVLASVPNEEVPETRSITGAETETDAYNVLSRTRSKAMLKTVSYHPASARTARRPMFFTVSDPTPSVQAAPAANISHPSNTPVSGTQDSETVYRGSSNFNKNFPIVGLNGRGENSIELMAAYNSQVWTFDPSQNAYFYNVNHDWPAPGFNLNFGKLLSAADHTYLIVMGDGTRHVTTNALPFITTDGSFIQLFSGGAGNYLAYFPDGSVISYQNLGGGSYWYPTKINDRNGNFFTITYRTTVPQINYITDNLGRVVQFNYDTGGNLISIDAPDLNLQRRTVVKFSYTTIAVSSSFTGGTVVFDESTTNTYTVPSRIYYPQNGEGYLFTYGAYGMISHLSKRLGMTDTTDGTEIAYTDYNYPTSGPLSDVPRFTQRQEWWANADPGVTVPATYTYSDTNDGTYNIYKITDPLGNSTVQKTAMSGTYTGLLAISETQDSSGSALQRITNTWELDTLLVNTPRIQQMAYLDVPANLTKHTEFSYPSTMPTYNNVTEQREYGYAGELLRKTDFTYVTDTNYMQPVASRPAIGKPRLYNLLKSQTTYDGPTGTLMSRSEYDYDTTTLTDRTESGGAVTGHDRTNFPTTFIYRGNQTAVRQYPDYVNSPSTTMQRNASYDILGNVTSQDLSCCQSKTFSYITGNHYAWPSTIQSGSGPSITEDYTYDFSTGLVTADTTHDSPTNHTTSYSYTAGTLRPDQTTFPTGAFQIMSYDDVNLTMTKTAYNSSSTQVGQQQNFLNGIGQTKAVKQWAGGSNYDETDMQYDVLGRLSKKTNPYRVGSESQRWSTYVYDNLGRNITVTLPDSQIIQTNYNGQYVQAIDQVGRQRVTKADALGRPINVIEVVAATSDYPGYNSQTTPWGTVSGYSSSYTYDALNNITQINQGSQTRLFVYDGLNRLLYDKQSEQTGTIVYNGQSYANKYEWDSSNPKNLRRKTDSRGAVISYAYDGLNRIIAQHYSGSPTASDFFYYWDGGTSVSFGGDSFVSSFSQSIAASLPSGFSTNNAVGQLSAIVNSANSGGDFYQYGTNGGVTKYVQRVSGNDFAINTTFDSLLHPSSVQYPSGLTINYGYDAAQRLSSISSSSSNYVSSVNYNGADQITNLQMGDGTTETYSYNLDRMQLNGQQVTSGSSTLLNLSYTYNATSAGKFGAGTTTGNTGQLVAMTDSTPGGAGKTVNYTYDLLGRLKTASTSSDWNLTESYDIYGNRTSQSDTSSYGLNRTDSIDANTNRITTTGFSYDNAGNLTASPNYTSTFDAENRLTQAAQVSPSAATNYSYNASRNRVQRVAADGTTYYISSPGQQELSEKAPDGSWRDFVYFGTRLIAEVTSGGTNYHHADLISTRVVTNSSGTILSQQQSAPFGETVIDTGNATAFKFSTYKRDISGTAGDYAVNRQFSASLGRFSQPDPLGMGAVSLADPQTLNLYGYTANDPINLTDPSGLYKGCAHKAMVDFISKLAGKSDSVAAALAQAAGDGPGGADSFQYSATNPINFIKGIFGRGPSAQIHFASQQTLNQGIANFNSNVNSRDPNRLQQAGFTLHSIGDVDGAHQGFHLPFGHAFTTLLSFVGIGQDPDKVIGDAKFINATNKIFQVVSGDPNASLSDQQMNDLISAIEAGCGIAAKPAGWKITRPPVLFTNGSGNINPFVGLGRGMGFGWTSLDYLYLWSESQGRVTVEYGP